ncbi:multidrug effflux MFS transporter [Vibrio ostreicida]|uniref:multidrug effflux MFS transporter n=1 Tax=Vibrio ostreicida TaxID=526588 RepID=UPI001FEAAA9A|nr:multidrug effflux MFS transporter [Vibrio ostreicida]
MFPISHHGKWFRFLMIFVFVAAAVETDIYLPTFPDILNDMDTNAVMVQRILSFNFIGICIGSLLYGPMSDHFGRKPVLMFGFTLFLISSLGCTLAGTIEQLLAFRLVQGFGSSACMIIGAAMVFDLFEEEAAAKLVADLNTLVVSLMAFAPLIGGWINIKMGYQANFIFIAALVAMSAFTCGIFLPESLPPARRKRFAGKRVMSEYTTVMCSATFWYNTLVTSLLLAAYMVYVSSMSLLYVEQLHVEKEHFPYYQIATLGTFVVVSLNNGRLIDMIGMDKLKNIGLGVVFMATALFFLVPETALSSPLWLTGIMCLFSVGAGLSIGLFFSKSMQVFPDLTGVAASLVTAIRLIIVAVAIDLASNFYDGRPESLVQAVASVVVLLLATTLAYYAYRATQPAIDDITPL